MKLWAILSLFCISASAADFQLKVTVPFQVSLSGEVGKTYRIQSAPSIDAIQIDFVVTDGNSILSGGGLPAGTDYASVLSAALNAGHTNLAIRGSTGADMLARFDTRTAPQIRPNSIIVYDMGVNDLTGGASVEEVEARIDAYYLKCRGAGWTDDRIFIRPISPSYFSGTFTSANRNAVNAHTLAKYPLNAMDPASEPRIYKTGQNSNPEFYRDLTHLTALGTSIDAAAMLAKISTQAWVPLKTVTLSLPFESCFDVAPQGMRFFRALEN